MYPSSAPRSQFKLQRLVSRKGVAPAVFPRELRYHALPNTFRIVTHAPAAFAVARLPQSPVRADHKPEILELGSPGTGTNERPAHPQLLAAHLWPAPRMEVPCYGD